MSIGTDRPRLARAAALLALALAGSGCGDGPGDSPAPRGAAQSEGTARTQPPSVAAPAALSPDEKLAEAVREAMLQAPALARQEVVIAVVQGQVFLAGEVDAPHLRDEAVVVAGEVPGVRGVQSKISVKRR